MKNWRPISLLNTDYKIIARILSNRLQKVLPSIINEDQTGYIKNRYIGENIRTILDILEHTSTKHNPGVIVFLDFEKAFDTVSWNFLHKTLDYFRFGESFKTWIKILYHDINSCVLNNGYSSPFFKIQRGVRQGCPLSALLFILVAEIMAIHIRKSKNINGLQYQNAEIKIKQLADDTTIFLKNYNSLENTLKILDKFEKAAGLKLNTSKTEAMRLGACNNLPCNKLGIKIVEKTRSLGIHITKNANLLVEENFNDKYSKISNLLNMWQQRNLTIKGKITLIKQKALPMLLYTASMLYTPPKFIAKFEQLFFKFVWPRGKHHVPKNVIVQSIPDGGLNMPDIETVIQTIKISWIKRLLDLDKNCNKVASKLAHIPDFNYFFNSKANYKLLTPQPSPFYKQIIEYWNLLEDNKKTPNEILNETITENKNICIDGKHVNISAFKNQNTIIIKDLRTLERNKRYPQILLIFLADHLFDILNWKSKRKSTFTVQILRYHLFKNTTFL